MSTTTLDFSYCHQALREHRRMKGLVKALARVPDFRVNRRKRHPLVTILTIALMTYLSGSTGYRDMEAYGHMFFDKLSRFVDLSAGVPDWTTFARVFRLMRPSHLAEGLGVWLLACAGRIDGATVSFDGKTKKRAAAKGGRAPHIESAWIDDADIALGLERVGEKSNEIVAIPALMRRLLLRGAIITFDAMGCQREIASTCRELGAHYLMPLKDNQPTAHAEILSFMRHKRRDAPSSLSYSRTDDKGHSRVETRRVWFSDDIGWFADRWKWKDLAGFVMVETVRTVDGVPTEPSVRCFLTSLKANAADLRRIVRRHWGVENRLHWVLDVVMGEDYSRARCGFAPENVNALMKVAISLLRRNGRSGSVKENRRDCAWSFEFALSVLTGEGEEVA